MKKIYLTFLLTLVSTMATWAKVWNGDLNLSLALPVQGDSVTLSSSFSLTNGYLAKSIIFYDDKLYQRQESAEVTFVRVYVSALLSAADYDDYRALNGSDDIWLVWTSYTSSSTTVTGHFTGFYTKAELAANLDAVRNATVNKVSASELAAYKSNVTNAATAAAARGLYDTYVDKIKLSDAKMAAKTAIDTQVANEGRVDVSSVGADYKSQIDAATTCAQVFSLLQEAQATIDQTAANALAQTKQDAIAEINALIDGSEDAYAISTANKYVTRIETAQTSVEVEALLDEVKQRVTDILSWMTALTIGFTSENMPIETQHNLEGMKMTFSEDGEQMTLTVNDAEVTYDLNNVGVLSYFRGTPSVSLHANQDPEHDNNYYTTFYSGLEAYTLPDGVKAYTAEVDGDVIMMTAIEGNVLPQAEAVLLYTQGSSNITMTVSNEAGTKAEVNQFDGVDVATAQSGVNYMLSYGQHGLGFYLMKEDMKLSANKVFLPQSANMVNARAFRTVFADGEADGISLITTSTEGEEMIYNLNGIRLNKLQKGINIVGGKKIVVK